MLDIYLKKVSNLFESFIFSVYFITCHILFNKKVATNFAPFVKYEVYFHVEFMWSYTYVTSITVQLGLYW